MYHKGRRRRRRRRERGGRGEKETKEKKGLYMYHKLAIIYTIFLHYSKPKVVRACLL